MLASLTRPTLKRMPLANRRWLAQVLRHIANIADPPPKRTVEIPKAGILGDLRDGARAE